jgi:hypothetical protein
MKFRIVAISAETRHDATDHTEFEPEINRPSAMMAGEKASRMELDIKWRTWNASSDQVESRCM